MQIVGIFNILFGNFNQNNFVTRAVDNNKIIIKKNGEQDEMKIKQIVSRVDRICIYGNVLQTTTRANKQIRLHNITVSITFSSPSFTHAHKTIFFYPFYCTFFPSTTTKLFFFSEAFMLYYRIFMRAHPFHTKFS